jgi:hypothetical protein
VRLTARAARCARDATARALYGALVRALLQQANAALDPAAGLARRRAAAAAAVAAAQGQPSRTALGSSLGSALGPSGGPGEAPLQAWVGVLDVGGFEPLSSTAEAARSGGLAALLANHADEVLQRHFAHEHVKAGAELYAREGWHVPGLRLLTSSPSRGSSSGSSSSSSSSSWGDGDSDDAERALAASLALVADPRTGVLPSLNDLCRGPRPSEVRAPDVHDSLTATGYFASLLAFTLVFRPFVLCVCTLGALRIPLVYRLGLGLGLG